ncbi:MAG: hypothetical protein ACP5HM_06245 [Anaerolineae bacterium]
MCNRVPPRVRAMLLTVVVALVVASTAIVPQFWQRVKADGGRVFPAYTLPPGYFGPRLYLPLVFGEGCVAVEGVEITGDTEGLPGTYTFETTVTPANATGPVTYSWDNGDTTETSTRDLGAGEHTLAVTVCNCGADACVDDEHTIVIRGY